MCMRTSQGRGPAGRWDGSRPPRPPDAAVWSPAGCRRLRPTRQGLSRPSRSPARRGTGLLTGGQVHVAGQVPIRPTVGVSHGTDCFVTDWYNDQRSFRILPLRGGSRHMATLLLIDDEPDLLRDRVSHVFPAPAHRVEIAQTGAEGLERVALSVSPQAGTPCPDVILLDLRLPDQSGLDILRQLRRFDARIPVVIVTVLRSADSAIEAMRQGAYDYLLKPIDLQKLDRVLSEALKVSRLTRNRRKRPALKLAEFPRVRFATRPVNQNASPFLVRALREISGTHLQSGATARNRSCCLKK